MNNNQETKRKYNWIQALLFGLSIISLAVMIFVKNREITRITGITAIAFLCAYIIYTTYKDKRFSPVVRVLITIGFTAYLIFYALSQYEIV